MVKPRAIRKGDMVRVIGIPPDLHDSARIGTPQVFRSALGKTFRVEGINERGYLELVVGEGSDDRNYFSDTIWIEPEFVELLGDATRTV
jgi:hypothetical protein